ncbi:MAG: hypothetical protein Q7S86_02655 [bacterium]|nr:hypothetical protein [bacterium]
MKRTIVALLFALATIGGLPAHAADDSLVGKYDGTFTITRPAVNIGMRINIDSQDGQNVKGSATFYGRFCAGKFPLEGTAVGQVVTLATNPTSYCESRKFDLRHEGKKLVGTLTVDTGSMAGTYPMEVSK